jgi:monooxygenase
LVVRGQLFVADDAPATLSILLGDESLARVGIALELVIVLAQALTAVWFYRLFRSINRLAAGSLTAFGLANAVAILVSAALLATALDSATGASSTIADDPATTVQLMYVISGNLWGVAALFFGLWLLPMGLAGASLRLDAASPGVDPHRRRPGLHAERFRHVPLPGRRREPVADRSLDRRRDLDHRLPDHLRHPSSPADPRNDLTPETGGVAPASSTAAVGGAAGDGDVKHLDVVIVGAGLSGVGAAYRLQTERPGTTYAVLEARASLGGTWDLFRYPGVRSDSDMYTLGYSFRPWRGHGWPADGPAIRSYIRETAREYGTEQHVRFHSKVVGGDFDTTTARWTLTVEDSRDRSRRTMTCGFLYACAGYYDYDRPYAPALPGVEGYAGTVVHPQFWPEDLDYAGKRVVVVGSGATAVTLVPALLEGSRAASHVTMLQRTPSWIGAVPRRDRLAERLEALLPPTPAYRAIRAKNIAVSTAFYQFCRRRPRQARQLLARVATRHLGDAGLVAEHFTPPYDPWDQRLCAAPGGDLFHAVRSGRAEVVTDRIATFVPEGIRLASGRVLPADLVVTATGLRLSAFGGMRLTVDGRRVELPKEYVWNGAMVTGVPNFAACIGYTNAPWTLRADLTHRLVCRVLRWMDEHDYAAVVPRVDGELAHRPLLDLSSGYVRRSIADFPRQGHRAPWRVRQNYLLDSLTTLRTDLARTLAVTPAGARVGSGVPVAPGGPTGDA